MKKYFRALTVLTFGMLLLFGWDFYPAVSATVPGVYSLVSSDSSGNQSNSSYNSNTSISDGGKLVAFRSSGTNLVAGDTNNAADIFVKNTQTGTTTRVSVDSSGVQANGTSFNPNISYDGRYVVFASYATNLVAGVSSSYSQIYIHDIQTGTTSLVSINSSGSVGNKGSDYPAVSADGRFVVFLSSSTNLVSGAASGVMEVYEKDMLTGTIKLLSQNSSGAEADAFSNPPHISCDGGVVAFSSTASNLSSPVYTSGPNVYVDTLSGGDNHLVDITATTDAGGDSPDVSCDGNKIVYSSNSTNIVTLNNTNVTNVFEYDRIESSNTLISVMSDGTELESNHIANYPSVSNDGKYILFWANAALDSHIITGEGALYIHDNTDGSTQAIALDGNEAIGAQNQPSLAPDGSYAAFLTSDGYFMSGINGDNLFTSKTGF